MGVSVLEAVHATVLVAGEAAHARLPEGTKEIITVIGARIRKKDCGYP